MPHRLVAELHKEGFSISHVEPDAKLHRFADSPSDDKESGYYVAFRNTVHKTNEFFYVILYGSWHWDRSPVVWSTIKESMLDRLDRMRYDQNLRKAKAKYEQEKLKRQSLTCDQANNIWNSLNDEFTPNFYLEKKKFTKLYGARIFGNALCVPMKDISGKLWNIEKRFPDNPFTKEKSKPMGLSGGKRDGLLHIIGDLGDVIYLCEGFANAVTVHMATGSGTVCSFSSGNMPIVASELFKKFPNSKFVVCGDNDQFNEKNIGLEKAQEAANLLCGKVIVPTFENLEGEPTDFWDLFNRSGIEEVKKQIESINPLEAPETITAENVMNAPYPDEVWNSGSKTATKLGTIENIETLLQRLRITVRYNVISREEEIRIPGLTTTLDNGANVKRAYIVSWCNRVKIPHAELDGYLTQLADRNLYNPVTTWILSKPWDGVSRLKDFYATIKSTHEPLKEALLSRWMLSAIAAAFRPQGVSAAGVLVFQGPQYIGKTKWFKGLVPAELDVLKDGILLRPDDKDSVHQAISKWLVELGELDATFRKSDIAQLKAFLTNDRDTIRVPYARKSSTYARHTVFFGSVNETDYLKDTTGNRRFWTVQCTEIDHSHSLDMQQVWSEFYEIYKSGETWYLTETELNELNAYNKGFEATDSTYEQTKDYFSAIKNAICFEEVTSTDVCKKLGISFPSNSDLRNVGRALRDMFGPPKKSNGRLLFKVPIIK